ncbi:MAG: hypothetical protein HeimC2_32440 [Candidatus Heimdallarchaeota archaeon LC_2]|nr:MAG: hypothetical protein HeimC2_32440 [Candidatus Heimdallarchaeota archaeon LC_2]
MLILSQLTLFSTESSISTGKLVPEISSARGDVIEGSIISGNYISERDFIIQRQESTSSIRSYNLIGSLSEYILPNQCQLVLGSTKFDEYLCVARSNVYGIIDNKVEYSYNISDFIPSLDFNNDSQFAYYTSAKEMGSKFYFTLNIDNSNKLNSSPKYETYLISLGKMHELEIINNATSQGIMFSEVHTADIIGIGYSVIKPRIKFKILNVEDYRYTEQSTLLTSNNSYPFNENEYEIPMGSYFDKIIAESDIIGTTKYGFIHKQKIATTLYLDLFTKFSTKREFLPYRSVIHHLPVMKDVVFLPLQSLMKIDHEKATTIDLGYIYSPKNQNQISKVSIEVTVPHNTRELIYTSYGSNYETYTLINYYTVENIYSQVIMSVPNFINDYINIPNLLWLSTTIVFSVLILIVYYFIKPKKLNESDLYPPN